MLNFMNFVRDMSFLSITLRLCAAVFCGGIIGLERTIKRRPAGFRTHILICLGAALTTLTSQYLLLVMHYYTDVARLGAQVVAGIGFIGAGTIIVTKRQRVKGLTTAAGLWAAAVIGLVCGAGYLECALVATAMILISEVWLIKIEYRFAHHAIDINLLVNYDRADVIEKIIIVAKEYRVRITDMEITRIKDSEENQHFCAILSLQTANSAHDEEFPKVLSGVSGILSVETL